MGNDVWGPVLWRSALATGEKLAKYACPGYAGKGMAWEARERLAAYGCTKNGLVPTFWTSGGNRTPQISSRNWTWILRFSHHPHVLSNRDPFELIFNCRARFLILITWIRSWIQKGMKLPKRTKKQAQQAWAGDGGQPPVASLKCTAPTTGRRPAFLRGNGTRLRGTSARGCLNKVQVSARSTKKNSSQWRSHLCKMDAHGTRKKTHIGLEEGWHRSLSAEELQIHTITHIHAFSRQPVPFPTEYRLSPFVVTLLLPLL